MPGMTPRTAVSPAFPTSTAPGGGASRAAGPEITAAVCTSPRASPMRLSAAAMAFFNPSTVREAWTMSCSSVDSSARNVSASDCEGWLTDLSCSSRRFRTGPSRPHSSAANPTFPRPVRRSITTSENHPHRHRPNRDSQPYSRTYNSSEYETSGQAGASVQPGARVGRAEHPVMDPCWLGWLGDHDRGQGREVARTRACCLGVAHEADAAGCSAVAELLRPIAHRRAVGTCPRRESGDRKGIRTTASRRHIRRPGPR